ncbi:5587_t:CDS:2 [Funneliformis mosseae]|uniref:5587_t:CDS:1 n=1 Tax=Funneliformis mosseae TaxID=27381 RepID=A0A9N9AG78_FUNMO|nr:5587_t:CDS:2 [Funneliformis mosseae]
MSHYPSKYSHDQNTACIFSVKIPYLKTQRYYFTNIINGSFPQ